MRRTHSRDSVGATQSSLHDRDVPDGKRGEGTEVPDERQAGQCATQPERECPHEGRRMLPACPGQLKKSLPKMLVHAHPHVQWLEAGGEKDRFLPCGRACGSPSRHLHTDLSRSERTIL